MRRTAPRRRARSEKRSNGFRSRPRSKDSRAEERSRCAADRQPEKPCAAARKESTETEHTPQAFPQDTPARNGPFDRDDDLQTAATTTPARRRIPARSIARKKTETARLPIRCRGADE